MNTRECLKAIAPIVEGLVLDECGTVLHTAKSGRVIIKTNRNVAVGTSLLDSSGRKVAKVLEVFGPVRSPYVSALPLTDRINGLQGSKVFVFVERRKSR